MEYFPPSDVKRQHLLGLFQEREHRLFVESGTYLGDTVSYFLPHADRIVSIEVDHALFASARERFADQPTVDILEGDARDLVPQLVQMAGQPALVWLDGHFSGDVTGQGAEVEPAATILRRLGRVPLPAGTTVVVDDLRLFGREPTFPTLDELLAAARAGFPAGRIYSGPDSLVVEG